MHNLLKNSLKIFVISLLLVFKVLIVNKISISTKYVNRAIITIDVNNLRNPQLGEGWF